jgi:Protein of unknown function (DUF2752)
MSPDAAQTTAQPTAVLSRGRLSAGMRAAVAGVWLGLAAAIGYVLAFNPTDRAADPTGKCTWHMLFGINGPSCGGTRMAWYLLHGDLAQAARHHLVALIGVPFALYALFAWTANSWFGRHWPPLRLSRWTYLSYVAAWLLYSVVLRNLPWQPFSWFDIPNLT